MDYEVEDKSICKLGYRDPSKWYFDDSPDWIEITDNNYKNIYEFILNNPEVKYNYIHHFDRIKQRSKYQYFITCYSESGPILYYLQAKQIVAIHFYD